MDQISTVGLDIAKNVFQTHGIDATGEVVVRRQFRRRQVHWLSGWQNRQVAWETRDRVDTPETLFYDLNPTENVA